MFGWFAFFHIDQIRRLDQVTKSQFAKPKRQPQLPITIMMSSTSSVCSSSTNTTTSSAQSYISRQKYAAAVTASIQLETKADQLAKLGKWDLALRQYQKSIDIQEAYIGNHHSVVSACHDKLLAKSGSWKKTSIHPSSVGFLQSFQLEKEADKLSKLGRPELAGRKYEQSYKLEKSILGEDHPMVSSLRQKIILARAA